MFCVAQQTGSSDINPQSSPEASLPSFGSLVGRLQEPGQCLRDSAPYWDFLLSLYQCLPPKHNQNTMETEKNLENETQEFAQRTRSRVYFIACLIYRLVFSRTRRTPHANKCLKFTCCNFRILRLEEQSLFYTTILAPEVSPQLPPKSQTKGLSF